MNEEEEEEGEHMQNLLHPNNFNEYGNEEVNDEPISPLINSKAKKFRDHWNHVKFEETFGDNKNLQKRDSDLNTDPSFQEID